MTLRWLKPDPGAEFIRTQCDRYTVARYPRSSDVPACYIAWKRKARKVNGEWQSDMLGKFDTSAAAMKFLNELEVAS